MKKIIGAVFFLSLVISVQAYSQSKANDLKSLNEKVDTLVATNQKNYQDVAQAMNLLTQVQQDFQSIRGTVEASKVLQKESDKVYQDLDIRVSALEDKINQIHQLVKEIRDNAPKAPTGPSPQTMKEVEEFQALLNMVNAEDYRGAASGFMGFLRKYPSSPFAGSAQYWVGESFFSMGDFTKAIAEFQILVDKYSQNPKVKEAIYKQGSAFLRLKKLPEAKLFFQKVIAAYPGTAEALQAQSRLLRIQELEQAGTNLASAQNPAAPPAPAGVKPSSGPVPAPAPGATAPIPQAPPPPAERPGPAQEGGTPLF